MSQWVRDVMADVKLSSDSVQFLDKVEGNLYVADGVTVRAKRSDTVTVLGTIRYEGDCSFECNLKADSIKGRHGTIAVKGNLTVMKKIEIHRGSLEVEGNLSARDIEVDKKVMVKENLEVENIVVGGKIIVSGNTKAVKIEAGGTLEVHGDLTAEKIDVGGSAKIEGATRALKVKVGGAFKGMGLVQVESVEVGGSFIAESEVDIEEIHVGGTVRVAGGRVKGRIDVGGAFKSTRPLFFNTINVGGTVSLAGRSEGKKIDVGGKLNVNGDLKFTEIDVGGTMKIEGTSEGEDIDVGGKISVKENLLLTGRLHVGGKAETGETLKCKSMEVGGSVKAKRIVAEDFVKVGRRIETADGTKASRVMIGRRGRIIGPIVAEEVLLDERAEAEDIYADVLTMERKSKARNAYVKKVYLEGDSIIMGELRYTEELKTEEEVTFGKDPEKTEDLPAPPI
ncbi:TPA: polymer-forming cytoskeletal protein [Candidatus Bathyarchaeota archaeon]|nr:polymer-forming cytoskeletal protein [Candidatus Bathyarchaeota archaeon]